MAIISSHHSWLLSTSDGQHSRRDTAARGVALRILPLGDSITWGQYSSDGNGYRLALFNSLISGSHVTFIGRERSGTMANNENEGHPGFPIGPVGQAGKADYALRPNVVLLMAGTNDVVFNINLDTAPATMGSVIDDILASCPAAALLVAEITPLLNPEREEKRERFNAALKDVVAARSDAGKHVALASMDRFATHHLNVTDGIHPSDEGYKQIAAVWHDSIVTAREKGWIEPPVPTSTQSASIQPTLPDNGPAETWSPAQISLYAMLVVGTLLLARRGVVILLRALGKLRST
ncbi:MAG: hypothetical protein L6R39_001704 [Caloplaca ligustica]|nr:MAG: hypothetical protein L6R39_001704 [Caloplaca ligustica]